jgi:hypothetical protein
VFASGESDIDVTTLCLFSTLSLLAILLFSILVDRSRFAVSMESLKEVVRSKREEFIKFRHETREKQRKAAKVQIAKIMTDWEIYWLLLAAAVSVVFVVATVQSCANTLVGHASPHSTNSRPVSLPFRRTDATPSRLVSSR